MIGLTSMADHSRREPTRSIQSIIWNSISYRFVGHPIELGRVLSSLVSSFVIVHWQSLAMYIKKGKYGRRTHDRLARYKQDFLACCTMVLCPNKGN